MKKHALSFSYFLFNNEITHVPVPIFPIYAIRIPVQFMPATKFACCKARKKPYGRFLSTKPTV